MPPREALPVHAVLFDYGNVLTGPPNPVAWAQMLEITGLPDEEFRKVYWEPRHDYDRGTLDATAYWLAAGRLVGLKLSTLQVQQLIAADIDLWTQPNQPMIDWASRLQSAGTPTGILSNIGDAMMHGLLARLPWLHRFDHRTWSHSLRIAKPEREIYEHAAQGLATDPKHILFIDDREDNILGAAAAGMQTIQYLNQPNFEEQMADRGLVRLWETGRF